MARCTVLPRPERTRRGAVQPPRRSRGREHDLVRRALETEAAVRPGDVDRAGGVHVGGHERRERTPGSALLEERATPSHRLERGAPVQSTGRPRSSRSPVSTEPNTPERRRAACRRGARPGKAPLGVRGRSLDPEAHRRRPRHAAVGRMSRPSSLGLHLQVGEVAAAAEAARAPVVAGDPLLVVGLDGVCGGDLAADSRRRRRASG